VSIGRPRAARDYKHVSRGDGDGFDLNQYRQFGIGLAVGLAVALGVWIYHMRSLPTSGLDQPQPQATAASGEQATVAEETPAEDPATDYDFYDMLPKFEVEVPAKERATATNPAARPVEQPGAYVIQVGSYRNLPDAERLRSQLGKLGIDATIQHADSWHRVRIGPFRDLPKLNATRRALHAADIDAIVMRVGD
jgi:cell division protein FtsN